MADRLLQHQPRRRFQQAGGLQAEARRLEQVGWRGQVADRRTVRVLRQGRGNALDVLQVQRVVADARQQVVQGPVLALLVPDALAQPGAEAFVAVLAAADRDHAEIRRQQAVA
jgi:hypothetical protein